MIKKKFHILKVVTAFLVLFLSFSGHALAAKRIALVIGNGIYQYPAMLPSLRNPPNDARGIAATLRKLGFDLIGGGVQLNLDKAGMENAIIEFGEQLGEGTVGLFYYAGHGLAVNRTNFLVPVDTDKLTKKTVNIKMVSADLVMDQFPRNGGMNIMILDACRNTPASMRGVRGSENEGLVQMNAPSGTLISYATQPGNVALDGTGDNSPYATALMQKMLQPGVGILEVFNNVGVAVEKSTDGFQRPWINSSPLEGAFYFNEAAPAKPQQNAAPAQQADVIAWQTIQNSTNPDAINAFIQGFPDSPFVGIAKARLQQLTSNDDKKQTELASLSPQKKPESVSPANQMIQNLLGFALNEAMKVKDIEDRANILINLAKTQHAAGKRAESRQAYAQAIRSATAHHDKEKVAQILYRIATSAIENGDIASAQSAASKIPQSNTYFSMLIGIIGVAQVEAGDMAGVQQTIDSVKDLEERKSELNSLVIKLAKAGNIIGALNIANKIDEESRRYALSVVATHQAKAGDVKGALISLRGIAESFRPFYMSGVARAQLEAGDEKGAFETMRRAVQIQNKYNDDVWNGANNLAGLAQNQAELGDIEGARATIKQALAASSESWPRQNTARAQAEVGDISDAMATLKKVTEDDSRDWGWQAVARIQAKRGDLDGALNLAKKIKDSEKRASTFETVISAMVDAGDYVQAIKTAEKHTDADTLAKAQLNIAMALVKAGKLAEAIRTASDYALKESELDKVLGAIVNAQIKNGAAAQALAIGKRISGTDAKDRALYAIVVDFMKDKNIAAATAVLKEFPKGTDYRKYTLSLIAQAQAKDENAGRSVAAGKSLKTESERDAYFATFAISTAEKGDFAQSLRITNRISSRKHRVNTLNGIVNEMLKKKSDKKAKL